VLLFKESSDLCWRIGEARASKNPGTDASIRHCSAPRISACIKRGGKPPD
jgi:hypothetical protein